MAGTAFKTLGHDRNLYIMRARAVNAGNDIDSK